MFFYHFCMSKKISLSFLFLVGVTIGGIFVFFGNTTSASQYYYAPYNAYSPQYNICSGDQGNPVCGERNGQLTLYENLCRMNANGARFISWNNCQYNNNYSYNNNTYNSNYSNYNTRYNTYYSPFYSHSLCSQEYDPVCTLSNGYKKTYSNRCFSHQAGAQFLYNGECDKKVKQKITCHFNSSSVRNRCSIQNGNQTESCSGESSCSFYTVSRKKGSWITLNNSCGQQRQIEIDGNSENISLQCQSSYNNRAHHNRHSHTYRENIFYPEIISSPVYYPNNQYYGAYSSSPYSYLTFTLSRVSDTQQSGSIGANQYFTVRVIGESANGTITHTIPDGVEFKSMIHGSCETTRVYNGTRLKCNNVSYIEYQAKARNKVTTAEFSTIYSGQGYNPVYRTFTLFIR